MTNSQKDKGALVTAPSPEVSVWEREVAQTCTPDEQLQFKIELVSWETNETCVEIIFYLQQ